MERWYTLTAEELAESWADSCGPNGEPNPPLSPDDLARLRDVLKTFFKGLVRSDVKTSRTVDIGD